VAVVCGLPVLATALFLPLLGDLPWNRLSSSIWTIQPLAQELVFFGFLYRRTRATMDRKHAVRRRHAHRGQLPRLVGPLMRRGLWLGMVWFGSAVSLAGFIWIVSSGRNVFAAAGVAALLFLVLTVYPLSFVMSKVPGNGETPTGHGPWSHYEVALMMFAFLVGATAVIIGVVLEEIVLGAAAGLAVFGLLGVGPAFLMRRIRSSAERTDDDGRDELFRYS
jgi:hypothetical protein